MLRNEDYKVNRYYLKELESNKDANKQWWVFYHESNPTNLELVFIDTKGNIRGDQVFIDFLIEKNIISKNEVYQPTKKYIRKYKDTVGRNQTNHIS